MVSYQMQDKDNTNNSKNRDRFFAAPRMTKRAALQAALFIRNWF